MKNYLISIFIGAAILAAMYNLTPDEVLSQQANIDKILVLKSDRKLLVFEKGQLLKSYSLSLGKNPVGAKEFEGDGKTPEGKYYISDKSDSSRFYKNLAISYPDSANSAYSAKLGKAPGGDIKIHGLRNGLGFIGKFHRLSDWTAGCIALTNAEIDEIYTHTPLGVEIEIRP